MRVEYLLTALVVRGTWQKTSTGRRFDQREYFLSRPYSRAKMDHDQPDRSMRTFPSRSTLAEMASCLDVTLDEISGLR